MPSYLTLLKYFLFSKLLIMKITVATHMCFFHLLFFLKKFSFSFQVFFYDFKIKSVFYISYSIQKPSSPSNYNEFLQGITSLTTINLLLQSSTSFIFLKSNFPTKRALRASGMAGRQVRSAGVSLCRFLKHISFL